MNVLFVHNNFPAQFRHVAAALKRRGVGRMAAIGSETAAEVEGVELRRYIAPGALASVHTFARRFESGVPPRRTGHVRGAEAEGGGFRT